MLELDFKPQQKAAPEGAAQVNQARTIILLHGFPAMRSKQNRDLAEHLTNRLGWRTRVPLYSGLGCAPGTFRFSHCLSQVDQFLAKLDGISSADGTRAPASAVDLVGHSWGGFLSLWLAAHSAVAKHIGRVVLLSPLVEFFPAGDSVKFFADVARDYPQLGLQPIDELANDFQALGEKYRTQEFIGKIAPGIELLILQSENDQTTPAEKIERRLDLFQRRPTYELFKTDHSFLENRPAVLERVTRFLSGT